MGKGEGKKKKGTETTTIFFFIEFETKWTARDFLYEFKEMGDIDGYKLHANLPIFQRMEQGLVKKRFSDKQTGRQGNNVKEFVFEENRGKFQGQSSKVWSNKKPFPDAIRNFEGESCAAGL